jgi:endonuclease/exonuclease/phosphatase family metal-dependent hydrolase
MRLNSKLTRWVENLVLPGFLWFSAVAYSQSNLTLRVVAANLTSGNNQRYETPGLNILQGLKPDIIAIQEFNYASTGGAGLNTPAAFREMLDRAFGTNFGYFRETGYSIPNGIISRYPMIASGSWLDSDTGVNDRGFAWARIDVPGTNDLYVVSVHLKASNSSSDASRRAAQAAELRALISTNFPVNAWIIVAGDFNIHAETENAVSTLGSFLSDEPVPTDLNGNPNTNQGRNRRYDRVLVSFSLTNSLTPVVMPSHTLTNGLVFVSTNYAPLSDVTPVQFGDSTVSGMQHLAVARDFRITLPQTPVVVPPPTLFMFSAGVMRWEGVSNVTYTVFSSTNLTHWASIGTAFSTTASLSFTNVSAGNAQRFYRVTYP